jgi:hypothetical protein
MHVDNMLRTGLFMKRIDVLRTEKEALAKVALEFR